MFALKAITRSAQLTCNKQFNVHVVLQVLCLPNNAQAYRR